MCKQHKKEGQSLVEMGLLLPLMLIIIFGIIDFGYLIYSYATIYQSTREAAEVASAAPPHPELAGPLRTTAYSAAERDSLPCVDAILRAAERPAVLFDDIDEYVRIAYPAYITDTGGNPLVAQERRRIGYPIEVQIEYPVVPLTPLWQLVPIRGTGEVTFTVSTSSRRTIGAFGRDPSAPNLAACFDPDP